MENLQVNQMEQIKPIMEIKRKPQEWRKITFSVSFRDEKIWCYRKFEKKDEYGNVYYQRGFFCSKPSCRNELIFRHDEESQGGRTLEPFRFHKLKVGSKEKVNEYGRTFTETTYYAFCCACAMKHENKNLDGIIKTKAKTLLKLELMNKCDCDEYINKQRTETKERISELNKKLETIKEIIKGLEAMRDMENSWKEKDTYKNERLKWLLSQERKDEERKIKDISDYNRTLRNLDKWESQRNEQLEEVNK